MFLIILTYLLNKMKKSKRSKKVVPTEMFVSKEPKTTKKLRNTAYIYCRVNSSGNIDSLERQRKCCEEYCLKEGLKVIQCFSGIESGSHKDGGRPEFTRMIDSMAKTKIYYLVAYSYDRITRDTMGDIPLFLKAKDLDLTIRTVTPFEEYRVKTDNKTLSYGKTNK
jgi:predicted site-specific integrase-resolvase